MNLDQNQSPSKPECSGQPSKWNELDGEIATAAYYIWEKEGYPHGRDLDHWLHAEHNVRRLVDAGKTREPAR